MLELSLFINLVLLVTIFVIIEIQKLSSSNFFELLKEYKKLKEDYNKIQKELEEIKKEIKK
jgi:cell division protein ZapA (FtsZ GTPase activity inhibitor)